MVIVIYHLTLKFPTSCGVGSIRESQFNFRECNNRAIKGFYKLYKPYSSSILEEEPNTYKGKNAVNSTYKYLRRITLKVRKSPSK